MEIRFHPLVQRDVDQILRYYESEGGRHVADRFYDALMVTIARIAAEPTEHHLVDEGLRRANVPGFPYHLLFRVHATFVRVLVLRHHRRHPRFGFGRPV